MSLTCKVPQLRFGEFSGEWEENFFGEIVTNKSKKYNPEKETISYKCIELEHLTSESGQLLGYVDSLKAGSIKNKFNEKDVLFGKLRPYLKKYLLAPFDGVCSSEIWVLSGKEISNNLLYYIVQTENFIGLANQSSGSKMPRADWNVLENATLLIPSKPEQEKIASFLSAVDGRIEQLGKKQKLLEQYKKGVMQRIFSQQLRFKADDGSEYPDWVEKTLGDIAEKQIRKNKDNAINNVFSNSAVQGIVNQRDYFDKDIANQNNLLNYYIIEKDDFIYNPRISNFAPVGPIGRNHLGLGVMSPLYSVFKIKQGNLDFFEQYFLTSNWYEYMEGIANYGARADRMNITSNSFYLMPLPFPSLEEQTKIVNFLNAINVKIDLASRQLDEVKNFKKALLQQMFV